MPELPNGFDDDRVVCVIVEGAGMPRAIVVQWRGARAFLRTVFYGDQPRNNERDETEEVQRWQHFSDPGNWSVGDDGHPFGYVGLVQDEDAIRAYVLTEYIVWRSER